MVKRSRGSCAIDAFASDHLGDRDSLLIEDRPHFSACQPAEVENEFMLKPIILRRAKRLRDLGGVGRRAGDQEEQHG
jgi:hypothetical protein